MVQHSFLRTTALVAIAAFLALALGACGLGKNPDAPRDENGKVTEQADIGAYKVRNGDCLLNPGMSGFTTVTVTPCSAEHDLEAFAQTPVTGDTYPGDDAVQKQYTDFCSAEFKKLMNTDVKTSVYSTTGLYPNQKSWDENEDRQILCLIGQVDVAASTGGDLTFKKTTGSLIDAKK